MRNRYAFLLLALVTTVAGGQTPARADFMYVEARDGELSGDMLNPTRLIAGEGVNTLTGTVVTLAGVAERDYVTVTIPAGLQFDSLVLSDYFGDDLTFVGMLAGTPFTVPPTDPPATIPPRLLGWVHMTPALIGTDLFPVMAGQTVPAPVMGFTAPLPSGDYSFWIQDTGGNAATYALTFNVSAIPEPSSLSLAGLAVLLALPYACRRGRQFFSQAVTRNNS
jgi:hypothetical protein